MNVGVGEGGIRIGGSLMEKITFELKFERWQFCERFTFFGLWTWQGRNLKNQETQQFFPCSSMEGPRQSFIHLVSHLSHTYSTLLVSRHVKDKNYSHWESKTDTTLYGTHVIMGIGQVITLFQPDTQDPTTPQWPHFLSRGMWGKVSFHYSSKEAKLEIFPKNFFSCETK